MANVRVTMNRGNIFALLHAPSGPVHRAVSSKLRKTEAIATATAPVDEGRLKNARTSGVTDEGSRIVGRLEFTVDYAIFVAKGHWVRRGPVRVKNAKALAFRINGQLVFAKSVGPVVNGPFVPPNPWLVNALKAGASPWPVTEL